MEIYVAHPSSINYSNLYNKLKNSRLAENHELVFPHDSDEFQNTKKVIRNSDLILAEVSKPSTGLGIELGWADIFDKKVIKIHQDGSEISSSLKVIEGPEISYSELENISALIEEKIK